MGPISKERRRYLTDRYWVYQRVCVAIAALFMAFTLLAGMVRLTAGVGDTALLTFGGIFVAAVLGVLLCRDLRHQLAYLWDTSEYRVLDYEILDTDGRPCIGYATPHQIEVVVASGNTLKLPFSKSSTTQCRRPITTTNHSSWCIDASTAGTNHPRAFHVE